MMLKFVFIYTLFLMVVAIPTRDRSTSPVELISVIELEEGCVRQGGICSRLEDCMPENLVQVRGILCPKQKHMGVECCYT